MVVLPVTSNLASITAGQNCDSVFQLAGPEYSEENIFYRTKFTPFRKRKQRIMKTRSCESSSRMSLQ
jgi:hypothetical protein